MAISCDGCACFFVFGVRKPDRGAKTGFDLYGSAQFDQARYIIGNHRDPCFAGVYFSGNSDLHENVSFENSIDALF